MNNEGSATPGPPRGTYTTAGPIFAIATRAYQRTKGAEDERSPNKEDAIVAVIFSVAAMETFINEIGTLASMSSGNPTYFPHEPPSIRILADLLEEIEGARGGSIRLKFSLARTVLSGGTPYEKGGQLYQDFDLLVSLRNQLIHFKELNEMQWSETDVPRIVERLRAKNILAEFPDSIPQPIIYFQTRAVARWACNTAAAIVQSILDVIPESELKGSTELFYRPRFKPVED